VEEPGYPPARLLFRTLGARVIGVPVDAEGLVVSALPKAARLVYVTPSHQFPLGVPMSLARRTALLAWAERRNALIIEDDYDSEFRFEGQAGNRRPTLEEGFSFATIPRSDWGEKSQSLLRSQAHSRSSEC
jgi:DNA-binding transcriptional MocR family regulator